MGIVPNKSTVPHESRDVFPGPRGKARLQVTECHGLLDHFVVVRDIALVYALVEDSRWIMPAAIALASDTSRGISQRVNTRLRDSPGEIESQL